MGPPSTQKKSPFLPTRIEGTHQLVELILQILLIYLYDTMHRVLRDMLKGRMKQNDVVAAYYTKNPVSWRFEAWW
jgi:hypothetical protein